MKANQYRADIDGLRALAVLSVLLFHLGIGRFSGGFLGVDIFFVISGFLITRLIRNEVLKTGRFSFSNFYTRRAKRLFPALFFTLCICLVVAYFLFSPQHLQRFGGALVYSLVSLSNFYFWRESGYFDTDADLKPLLHTWSLSVEEQFYLVWPIVLLILLASGRRFLTPIFILIAGLFSILLNIVFADGQIAVLERFSPTVASWFSDGASNIFYLAPFRVFEFGIGALLVWLIRFQPNDKRWLELLFLFGLAMMVWPIITYAEDAPLTLFNTLLACIGAALAIYSGTAQYSASIFNNPMAVGVGLISYSLYLIHWPIIVFYKYYKFDTLTSLEQGGIFIASIIVASFMYRFIEQPFRRGAVLKNFSRAGIGLTYMSLALAAIVLASNVWANKGWPWRFPTPESQVLQEQFEKDRSEFVAYMERPALYPTRFSENDKLKVLVIGDSQAKDFINIIEHLDTFEKLDIAFLRTRNACQSLVGVKFQDIERRLRKPWVDRCRRYYEEFDAAAHVLQQADVIVFTGSWISWGAQYFNLTTKHVRQHNPTAKIFVIGPKTQGFDSIAFAGRYGMLSVEEKIKAYRPYALEVSAYMEETLKNDPLIDRYVSMYDILCGEHEREHCVAFAPNGGMIMFDNNHLTPTGAKFLYDQMDAQGFWEDFRPN